MKIKFKRFSSPARIPQKARRGSACCDLFAARCVVLEPNTTRSVETDLGFCFSKKYVAKIYTGSSLPLRSIHLGGGIVDSDYRENVRVILTNLSDRRVKFNAGDRIAQVLFENKEKVDFFEVSSFDDCFTERGTGGLGSTGT